MSGYFGGITFTYTPLTVCSCQLSPNRIFSTEYEHQNPLWYPKKIVFGHFYLVWGKWAAIRYLCKIHNLLGP